MMQHRLRRRHRYDEPAEMNITAFMNLMVILVPFLLISVTFSQLAVLDVALPGDEARPTTAKAALALAIVIRNDGLEILDGEQRLAILPPREGQQDLAGLDDRLRRLKRAHTAVRQARVLAEAAIPYADVIAVMDRLRAGPGGEARFPDISLGDAPTQAAIQ